MEIMFYYLLFTFLEAKFPISQINFKIFHVTQQSFVCENKIPENCHLTSIITVDKMHRAITTTRCYNNTLVGRILSYQINFQDFSKPWEGDSANPESWSLNALCSIKMMLGSYQVEYGRRKAGIALEVLEQLWESRTQLAPARIGVCAGV